MHTLVVLAFVAVGIQSILSVAGQCSTNNDCTTHQCCATAHNGTKMCEDYRNVSDTCHMPNHGHHTVIYRCNCRPDLVCQHWTLDPGNHHHHNLDTAESLIDSIGIGICLPHLPPVLPIG